MDKVAMYEEVILDSIFEKKAAIERFESDCSVTKKVKNDYDSMTDDEFFKKYKTTKKVYAKRVKRYGDPYMNSPLAKFGKSNFAKTIVQNSDPQKAHKMLKFYGVLK